MALHCSTEELSVFNARVSMTVCSANAVVSVAAKSIFVWLFLPKKILFTKVPGVKVASFICLISIFGHLNTMSVATSVANQIQI